MSVRRPLRVLVLMPHVYDSVPGQRFRIEQWARTLPAERAAFTFLTFETPEVRAIVYARGRTAGKVAALARAVGRRVRQLARIDRRAWDVIFLFRELLPLGPPLLERRLARWGLPIVYDFDDAIFLPNVSEANRRFQWLKYPRKVEAICALSTHVTVGNAYLADYARRFNAHVSIVPTTIDTDRYEPKPDAVIRGVPTVGWSGSLTTIKHLRTAAPALRALRRRVAFRLKVVGATDFAIPGLDVESTGWSARTEVADLRSFDVGMMPLPDDLWSRGKCGLKALQYMAVGVPTVVSAVGVNTEIVEDGRNGFVAGAEGEWVDKLERLLADESLRARFAREGRRTVEERYSARTQAPRLLDVLDQAPSRRRTG